MGVLSLERTLEQGIWLEIKSAVARTLKLTLIFAHVMITIKTALQRYYKYSYGLQYTLRKTLEGKD